MANAYLGANQVEKCFLGSVDVSDAFLAGVAVCETISPLTFTWTSMVDDLPFDNIIGGTMRFSDDGGSTWATGIKVADTLTPGSHGGPWILEEEVAGAVTRININWWDNGDFFGNVTATGGSIENAVDMFAFLIADALDVQRLNFSNISNMTGMFYNITGIDYLDMSGIVAPAVTSLLATFAETSCTSMNFAGFNCPSVTNLEWMFGESASLTGVLDLISMDVSSVTNAEACFAILSDIVNSPIFPDWNLSSCGNMNHMFADSEKLTAVTNPNWDMSNSTSHVEIFLGCTDLQCISHLNTTSSTDKTDMFLNTPALAQPDATTRTDLTDAGGANWTNSGSCPPPPPPFTVTWDSMSGDRAIELQTTAAGGADMEYSGDGGSTWTDFAAGAQYVLTTTGGPCILREKVFGSVTIAKNMFSTFNNNPEFRGALKVYGGAVVSIEYMFKLCHGFTSVEINLPDVTNMNGVFEETRNGAFTMVDLSKMSSATIADSMLYYCQKMEAFNVVGMTSITDVSYAFRQCQALTASTLDFSSFSMATEVDGLYSEGTSGVKTIITPSNHFANVVNGENMFKSTNGIECISGLDTRTWTIRTDALDNSDPAGACPTPAQKTSLMGASGALVTCSC